MHRVEIAIVTGLLAFIFQGASIAAMAEAPAESTGMRFTVREDMRRMASPRSLGIVALGSAATAVAWAMEDPETQAQSLAGLGAIGDFGNAAGSPLVLLGGAATLVLAGRAADAPNVTAAGIDMARALAYSGATVAVLKVAVDRTRPDGDRYSFPSAHAAAAFSVAPVVGRHFGRVAGTAAYVLAGTAVIGRMRDRRHYLSDVLFGATLGLAAGDAMAGQRASAMASLVLEPGRWAIQARF